MVGGARTAYHPLRIRDDPRLPLTAERPSSGIFARMPDDIRPLGDCPRSNSEPRLATEDAVEFLMQRIAELRFRIWVARGPIAARSRLLPYRRPGCRSPSTPAAGATPGPRSRRRTAALFRGIGLDLMLAFLAPEDEANAGRCSVAERHRRAGVRAHRQSAECAGRCCDRLNRSPRPSFCE